MVKKVGEKSEESRIYECTVCGNVKALLEGEMFPHCEICYEAGKKQGWKKTPQEILIRTKDIKKEIEKKSALTDKISDAITAFCGNMFFVYTHIVWFSFWIIYNVTSYKPFDPFPFGLLTLIVSLEAIILATFILISQQRESEISEIRSELDYQTDVRAEKKIHEMLALQREIYEILSRKKKK